jgi:hypothetical protein
MKTAKTNKVLLSGIYLMFFSNLIDLVLKTVAQLFFLQV